MGTKGKNIFSEEGYDAHHIMQLKCKIYAHPWSFGFGKKVGHWIVQINIIWLNLVTW